MKQKMVAIQISVVAFALSGCATVMNGKNLDYTTSTEPSGAAVKFVHGESCVSPCSIELKRKSDQRVDLTLEGYKPTYVLIQSKLAGTTFGNIIAGGGIGAIVDGTNGASNRLHPRPLIVRLAKEGSADEAVLIDKKGKVIKTVKEHNDSVKMDVSKTIGAKLAGLEEPNVP